VLLLTYTTVTPCQGYRGDRSGSGLLEDMLAGVVDEETRRRAVASILVRLQRYVRGYLPDSRIETLEDLSSNPAEVTIRVWWKDERKQGPSE